MSDDVKEAEEMLDSIPEDKREEFIEAFGQPEELHEDLRPFVVDLGDVGTWIKHPLVFSIMHSSMLNAMVNEQYKNKLELLSKFEEEGRWFAIFFVIYERPYRLEAFMQLEHHLSDDDYWTILASLWTDSENIWQNEDDWHTCLTEHRSGRVENFMEDEEREVYKALPEELTVYRGYRRSDRVEGLSWTLSEKTARWFAKHLPSREDDSLARVTKGKVKREHVLAYFGSRQEDEVVVFPEWVTDREEFKA